jgi:DNA mismatch endonuclease (patch repair protein)
MDTVDPATRSRIMSRIPSRNSGPERAVVAALRRWGPPGWRRHFRAAGIELDVAWPRAHVGLLVNGCFWHGHDCGRSRMPKTRRRWWRAKLLGTVARDRRQRAKLATLGWRVVTLWECEIRG